MMNDYLLNYVGYSPKKQVLEDCHKYLLENKIKQLGFIPRPTEQALIYVTKNDEIKSIGGAIPTDLLSKNFGDYLGAHMRGASGTGVNVSAVPSVGGSETYRIGGTGAFYNNNVTGNRFQVGTGTTTPDRNDFNIEIPFANGGVEDSPASPIAGAGWVTGLGQVQVPISISPTTGSGSISEAVMFQVFQTNISVLRNWLWARDLISPVANFIAGQAINIQWIWQL